MLRFLLLLLRDLLLLCGWPYWRWRRAHACPMGAWLRVDVDGPVVEVVSPRGWWDPRPRPLVLEELRWLAQESAADPRVAGWLVVVKSFGDGTARATALRRVLASVRAAGKRVVVYLPDGAGTRVVYLASVADRILVGPHSQLAPLGFTVETLYLRGALEAVGVEAEVLACGRFKAAGERLVAREMSAEQRLQLDEILQVAHDELVEALAAGRSVPRDRAEQWVDEGPWTARGALEAGLVDAEAYEDELERGLAASGGGEAPIVLARRYSRRRRVRLVSPWRRPYLAVIELRGPIASAPPWPGLPVATAESFAKVVAKVREDRRARGALLLINSPGGSVLASDRLLHELRRLAAVKPVVACCEDVAASGGYLVALGAQAIVAEATTVTGSIGVIAARVSVEPLLRRLGLRVEVVKRGARADLGSMARPLAADERRHLERDLGAVYDAFVGEVARGRRLAPEQVRQCAEGRVYGGQAALERGLIDALGGFPRALAELRSRLGIDAERLEPCSTLPRPRLGELVGSLVGATLGIVAKGPWDAFIGAHPGLLGALVAAEASEPLALRCDVALIEQEPSRDLG